MSQNAYRSEILKPSDRIIVALDGMGWPQAEDTMDEVGRYVGMSRANAAREIAKELWRASY